MTTTPTFEGIACDEVRVALEAQFDSQLSVGIGSEVDRHLVTCTACCEFAGDLGAADRTLQQLSLLEFPADAMAQVLAQTVDSPTVRSVPILWRSSLTKLATAAVLLLAVSLSWVISQRAERGRERQLHRAVAETEYVLNVASNAVRRVENVTVHDVMQGHITGAVRRIPARWAEVSLSLFGR